MMNGNCIGIKWPVKAIPCLKRLSVVVSLVMIYSVLFYDKQTLKDLTDVKCNYYELS